MFERDKTLSEYIVLAKHYLAIGVQPIYLFGDEEKPWEIATKFESGGTHRLGIATSSNFKGKHPCGLSFRWSFDLEPRSANGSGSYQIDTEGIQRVLAKLTNHECRLKFLEYLKECAEKIEEHADNYQREATKQYGVAAMIRHAFNTSKLTSGRDPACTEPEPVKS